MLNCSCGLHTNRQVEGDPTRTKVIRDRFQGEVSKRFRKVRGDIRRAIIEQDVFALKGIKIQNTASPNQFDFPTSEAKVQAFMDWLRELEDEQILEVRERNDQGRIAERNAWERKYIRSAYQQGIERGRQELRNAGYDVPTLAGSGGLQAVFNQDFHADRVGLLYTRAFNELKGITDAMDQQISRVLSRGLAEGKNPRDLARWLNRTISGPYGDLGIVDELGRAIPAEQRAEMLARTEVVRAHHQATINEYKTAGVKGVRVKAEWSTAGDARVCPICAELEGQVFNIDEIESMIPRHPRCRCAAIPAGVGED